MKSILIQNNLVVKKSVIHGYGVFAQKNMLEGEMLEECHCIIYECNNFCIPNYPFAVINSIKPAVMVLPTGFGCIYNHSDMPNASYEIDPVSNIMTIKANNPIAEGEEIFISYGDSWFSKRNLKFKKIPLWFRSKKSLVILLKLLGIAVIYLSITWLMKYLK